MNAKFKNYEILSLPIIPCYSYVDGDKSEEYWADWLNCQHYMDSDNIEDYTILLPYKPKGMKITDENMNEVVWLTESGNEWDFDNHRMKTE